MGDIRTFEVGPLKAKHKTIGQYGKFLKKHPEENAPFLKQRALWISQANDNPTGRVSKAMLADTQVAIKQAEEDELSAPEENFVTVAAWRKRMAIKFPEKGPEEIDKLHPNMYDIPTTTENFKGKTIEGFYETVGEEGVYKKHSRSCFLCCSSCECSIPCHLHPPVLSTSP